MSLLLVRRWRRTSEVKECSDDEYVGDDDGDGHDEDDARLGETLQPEHDFHVIVGVTENYHSRRGVPGAEHAGSGPLASGSRLWARPRMQVAPPTRHAVAGSPHQVTERSHGSPATKSRLSTKPDTAKRAAPDANSRSPPPDVKTNRRRPRVALPDLNLNWIWMHHPQNWRFLSEPGYLHLILLSDDWIIILYTRAVLLWC